MLRMGLAMVLAIIYRRMRLGVIPLGMRLRIVQQGVMWS